jgi:butyrate kinase
MFTVLKPLREKEASLNKAIGVICSELRKEVSDSKATGDIYEKAAYLETILNLVDLLEESHEFTIEDELDDLAESLLMVDKLKEDCEKYNFDYMKSRFNKAFNKLLEWKVIHES